MSLWTSNGVSGAAITSAGTWAATGGAAPAVLADGADGTYVRKTSLGAGDVLCYPTPNITIPSNEVALGLRWRCRMARGAGTVVSVNLGDATGGIIGLGTSLSGAASIATLLGPWVTSRVVTKGAAATPLTQADVNDASLILNDSTTAGSTAVVYELGLDLQTASIPTVAIATPTGTVVDDLAPAAVWTFTDYSTATVSNKALTTNVVTLTTSSAHGFQVGNDVTVAIGDAVFDGVFKIASTPTTTTFTYAKVNANVASTGTTGTATIGDGASQSSYLVKWFSAAQYGAGGFNPATSTPTASVAGTGLGTRSVRPSAPLANATTYRAYITASKTLSGLTVDAAYAYTTFTTAATLPPAPAITATFDPTANRCAVVVQNSGNLLPANDASAETGVGTWTAVTNMGAPTASATVAHHLTQSVRMSSTAGGTMTMRTASGTSGVPVVEGQAYSVLAQVRAGASARTCRVGVQFYTSAGATIGGVVYGTGVADATGSWTALTLLTTAPATSAFAAVFLEVASTGGAAELHYADSIGLCAGGTASSPNLLADPSFEAATVPTYLGTSWIGSTAVTLAVSASLAFAGSQSVLMTLPNAAAGASGAQVRLDALTVGATYTLSVYVRVPSGGAPRMYLKDIFGTPTGVTYGTRDTGATTNAYVRLSVAFTATAATHYFGVATDAASTAGQTINLDAIQLEVGATATAFSIPGVTTWSPGGRAYVVTVTRTQGTEVTTVRDGSALVPDATGRVSILDYEATRGLAVTYTATVTASVAAATTITSTGSATAITPTNDGRYWIKAVTDPSLNVAGLRVTGTPSSSREEHVGEFRLDGRDDTVVVAGQTFGDDVDFTVTTSTAAEFDAAHAILVDHQGTLLLQEPWYDAAGVGRQRWIRVTGRSWTQDGVPEAPRSTFSLKSLEVGKGY